jgi:hypothetical protein
MRAQDEVQRFYSMMLRLSLMAIVVLLGGLMGRAVVARDDPSPRLKAVVQVIEDYKTPGLEAELSGIFPHATDSNLYYVLANQKPPYRTGQKPMLPLEYRGKLLTVDKRTGKVVKAIKLAGAEYDFGGLVVADGYFYVASTNSAEILKVDPEANKIVTRYQLPSPAGGLGYDKERGILIAQLFVGHPHLAVVDLKTGLIKENLWSDESAMGLAKVDGDWLCTWASGWDPGSFSELRVLDPKTGKPRERIPLGGVHTAIAPDTDSHGDPAFISLLTVNSRTGETVVRKFSYKGESRSVASATSQQ